MAKAYFKWKELLVYEDGGEYLQFEAPMGKSPHDVYVPTADAWMDIAPDWAKPKRDEIIAMVRSVEGVGRIILDNKAWVETGSIGGKE